MPGLAEILHPAILFALPLLLAALGELIVERAGIVNISIEGMMLAGALAAWIANGVLGPSAGPACGFLAAILAAAILALLFAAAAIGLGADQIVTGTGVNLLAFGLTALAYKRVSPAMADLKITGVLPLWMSLVVVLLMLAAGLFFARTRAGLELAAIGEAPDAADAAGISVNRRKLAALLFGAACAGLAGAYLSTMRVQGFVENMTEGQGFLALAIVIFGRWNVAGVVAAGLFFGLIRAGANLLETRGALGDAAAQLTKLLPYVVSLLALAGVAGRSGEPASLGRPFERK